MSDTPTPPGLPPPADPAAPSARRPVVVRHTLPAPPERVFRLFTTSGDLQRWFCDAVDTEPREGGLLHAAWQDDEGEPWDRMGRFVVFEPPRRVVIEWEAPVPERLQVAIMAADGGTCEVTVVSPLPVVDAAVRDEVLREAATAGWAHTFEALAGLLDAEARAREPAR